MTSTEEKPIVVSWEGDDDPENPRNWSRTQKWIVTGLISVNVMLSHISSTMIAPAARNVAMDLGSTTPIFEPLLTSIFFLGHAFVLSYFGAIFYVCGHSRTVQLGNMFYIIFNLVCAFAKTPDQMLWFRFLAGIGGSVPLSLGGRVINSCWSGKDLNGPKHLYTLALLLAPIVGPIAGAWITMKTTWRWIFWTTSIASTLIQVGHFFWLRETFAPIILARKAKRLQNASSGEENVRYVTSNQQNPFNDSVYKFLLLYPVCLLVTEPIIQLTGIYLAYMADLLYFPQSCFLGHISDILTVILTSIPGIFVGVYHESIGIAGLHYIAFGIGLYGGAQIANAIQDNLYRRLSAHYGTDDCPEFRIPLMLPATLFVATGLLIAGWSVSSGVYWVVTDIGFVITGIGITVNWQTMQRYIMYTYAVRTSSALEGVSILRSVVAFALPLCSPSLSAIMIFRTSFKT
ncbi:related to synaptic vesicle transporter SVOP and related transporters (major facilitator superfamily) [Armillaria ostoyae]|uniref:Related to synaptic vesicle transporter SVOP and related transporters (Major facilitator superfamily) n=1 Tax=Armillaria ostoyae TaxID=47428 RepID=A0A284RS59_ARMOS|nr:related to synaptic vesicle transporter SVOP and related transporters (major facilitator superfamily) [Armillaria ostoyae]